MTTPAPNPFPFSLVATGVGSMPHTNPRTAAEAVVKTLPELPFWPQLPNRSPLEQMAAQFLSEVPSASVTDDAVLIPELPEGDVSSAIGPQRVPGLYSMIDARAKNPKGIKGQVTGPITLGALVRLHGGIRAIDSREGREWLAEHIGRVAQWQEHFLSQINPQTLVFIDEPYLLQAIAEEWVSLQEIHDLIATCAGHLTGLVGLHCCATPPWSFLVELPVKVLSFDAYRYSATMFSAVDQIKAFLDKGGSIAWGVVPSESYSLGHTSPPELCALLDHVWRTLAEKGIPMNQLVRQSMITPSCGLARLTPDESIHALEMARQIGADLRIMMMQHMIGKPR